MPERPRVSVVIPVHNEEDDVGELARLLHGVLEDPYEIIFIDDGSTDGTWRRLLSVHQPGRVRLLRFRRNFGKTAALMAGFAASRGEVVLTMDGDLQDEPTEIPRFLRKLEEGYDVVCGWKKVRHDPASKLVASRLFNSVVRKVTGVALHDVNCGFKALRGDLARSLRIYGELHRFIPILVAAQGFRVSELIVRHQPRRHGRSKYGLSRAFQAFFDLVTVLLVTRFASRPSHGFGFAAFAFFGSGVVLAGIHFWLYERLSLHLLAGVLWIGGFVFLAAGWVAETVLAQGHRFAALPLYWIEEKLD